MNISKRLKTMVTLIPNDSNVIDVGCDHALLDIYLTINKNCTCKACDINENALNQAKKNIKKYNLSSKIETILTDGINEISISDNDIIVISGMGTNTIKHILSSKSLSNNLIIATQNDISELRKFVINLGYKIIDELFIIDKGKPYIIINFLKGHSNYNDEDINIGPILKNNQQYIDYLINKLIIIKKKIPFYKFKLHFELNKKIKNLQK